MAIRKANATNSNSTTFGMENEGSMNEHRVGIKNACLIPQFHALSVPTDVFCYFSKIFHIKVFWAYDEITRQNKWEDYHCIISTERQTLVTTLNGVSPSTFGFLASVASWIYHCFECCMWACVCQLCKGKINVHAYSAYWRLTMPTLLH